MTKWQHTKQQGDDIAWGRMARDTAEELDDIRQQLGSVWAKLLAATDSPGLGAPIAGVDIYAPYSATVDTLWELIKAVNWASRLSLDDGYRTIPKQQEADHD